MSRDEIELMEATAQLDAYSLLDYFDESEEPRFQWLINITNRRIEDIRGRINEAEKARD